jgi:transposase
MISESGACSTPAKHLPNNRTSQHNAGALGKGRKRHVLVGTLGLLLAVHVTAADVSDRDGAMALLGRLDRRRLPRLRAGWVDGGYRGGFLAWAAEKVKLRLEVVQRADGGRHRRWLPTGAEPPTVPRLAVVPRRWVVERTFSDTL